MEILKTISENNNYNDRVKIVMSKVKINKYNIFLYSNYIGKRINTFNPKKFT